MYGQHQKNDRAFQQQHRSREYHDDYGISHNASDGYRNANGNGNANGSTRGGYASADDNDSLWDDDADDHPIAASHCPLDARKGSYRSSASSSHSSSDWYMGGDRTMRKHSEELEGHCNAENADPDSSEDNTDGRTSSSSSVSSSSSSSSSTSTSSTSSSSSAGDTISDDASSTISVRSVVEMIEDLVLQTVIEPLSREPDPAVPEINASVDAIDFKRKLSLHHLTQARSLTSILKVAAFCYELLVPCTIVAERETTEDRNSVAHSDAGNIDEEEEGARGTNGGPHRRRNGHRKLLQIPQRTTTTREVYYFYVTYFRDQRECDKAIWDLVCILGLPSRQSLGLVASPKGWFCGSIDVYNAHTGELKFNGRELDAHGTAITPSTYDNSSYHYYRGNTSGSGSDKVNGGCGSDDTEVLYSNNISSNHIRIESDAKCILVIEKEGVYTRLSEDKFFLRYFPCILVTGKGFPDIATRRWVKKMQKTLNIPVYGLCDCNPFGVSVLDSYRHDQGVRLHRKSKSCHDDDNDDDDNDNDRKKRRHKRKNQHQSENRSDPLDDLHWIGLRPSQVETMDLPSQVFQELTTNDKKRLQSLLVPRSTHSGSFAERGGRDKAERIRELKAMRNYKVELEALHWKGSDYLCQFVHRAIRSEYERYKPTVSMRPTKGRGRRLQP